MAPRRSSGGAGAGRRDRAELHGPGAHVRCARPRDMGSSAARGPPARPRRRAVHGEERALLRRIRGGRPAHPTRLDAAGPRVRGAVDRTGRDHRGGHGHPVPERVAGVGAVARADPRDPHGRGSLRADSSRRSPRRSAAGETGSSPSRATVASSSCRRRGTIRAGLRGAPGHPSWRSRTCERPPPRRRSASTARPRGERAR